MSVRVRFAPSPTGQVHIGNIRTAIFNWLFARHEGGEFLLRVEDTDRARSTPEAIAALLDVMGWLGLDYDEEPVYQSQRAGAHGAAAERMLAEGWAYRDDRGDAGSVIVFRIPWSAPELPFVQAGEEVEYPVHPEQPVQVSGEGLNWAGVSKKGKPVPQAACLGGFHQLRLFDGGGNCTFALEDHVQELLAGGDSIMIEGAESMRFQRHSVVYEDAILGELAKPLDSLKDLVIVRSDGSPVFHLANVVDDLDQQVTHIIRGNDHVENTYRHIFLFHALGAQPPTYAHLPMIVNKQGKPYSKRDGDAFVGEFRDKGLLPEALFNYLALLGWSPGDDREKMTRDEMVEAFSLDRVNRTAAQMDSRKLENLNGQYMAELPLDDFVRRAKAAIADEPWLADVDDDYFARVAELMQSRCKVLEDARDWNYFFVDELQYSEKGVRKFLRNEDVLPALKLVRDLLREGEFDETAAEGAVTGATAATGLDHGKLNQPLRVALTGGTVGAGIYETMAVLGRDRVLARLDHAIEELCEPNG